MNPVVCPDPLVPGWRDVPAHDPTVQDAANHAVKTIQERSNSLAPYELLEVLRAKAEVDFFPFFSRFLRFISIFMLIVGRYFRI